MLKRLFTISFSTIIFAVSILAQTEILTTPDVIEMAKAGLSKDIIIKKLKSSAGDFDVSAKSLIELKKANIDDEIILLMMEKPKEIAAAQTQTAQGFSENSPIIENKTSDEPILSAKQSLLSAKTIAIEKSSLHPSRQALEKALFKRKDWKDYNLTIVRYKDQADLYIEIGRIPLTWITHRYVFRIYDRRNGVIITAGETTSWGSLAENMAREIVQKLKATTENSR